MSFGIIVALQFAITASVCGQSWQDIVPLETTCDDVKRMFGVEKCTLPHMTIEKSDYRIVLDFAADSKECRVTKTRVIRAFIDFTNVPRLDDFERNFTSWTVRAEYDAPEITVYSNRSKGIKLEVQNYGTTEKYISTVSLTPSTENLKKFRCRTD